MVTIIKRGAAKQSILNLLKKLQIHKGVDAFKYCGIIHLPEDPAVIQKRMRDEWR